MLPIFRLIFFVMMIMPITVSKIHAITMTAGTASASIINQTPRSMVNGRVSEGAHSELKARVVVLNDGHYRLVFVTYDLNCFDVATPILRQRAKDELGLYHSHPRIGSP